MSKPHAIMSLTFSRSILQRYKSLVRRADHVPHGVVQREILEEELLVVSHLHDQGKVERLLQIPPHSESTSAMESRQDLVNRKGIRWPRCIASELGPMAVSKGFTRTLLKSHLGQCRDTPSPCSEFCPKSSSCRGARRRCCCGESVGGETYIHAHSGRTGAGSGGPSCPTHARFCTAMGTVSFYLILSKPCNDLWGDLLAAKLLCRP